VRTLLDRPAAKIRLAVNTVFNQRDRDKFVLVYFTGHGVRDADGRLYFAAAGVTASRPSAIASTDAE
jgi:uncharacterized caspase-like protein